jgi:hypothetical protein
MNRYFQEKWPWIEGAHYLRLEVLNTLQDTDLRFTPGGQNVTLGVLLREIGEVQHAYNESLRTFKQDWSYRNAEPGLDASTTQLKAWYDTLDADTKATVEALTDDDLRKTVDRNGAPMPVEFHLDAYLQAQLIFLAKAAVYLRAMNRPLPGPMAEYIG